MIEARLGLAIMTSLLTWGCVCSYEPLRVVSSPADGRAPSGPHIVVVNPTAEKICTVRIWNDDDGERTIRNRLHPDGVIDAGASRAFAVREGVWNVQVVGCPHTVGPSVRELRVGRSPVWVAYSTCE